MGIGASTLVAMSMAFRLAIEHPHHPPTASAAHQPGQERPPAAGRLARTILLHVRVLEQKPLIVLVVLPADVARMVVPQQDVPLLSRLLEAADLTRPAVDNACSLGLSAERIGP